MPLVCKQKDFHSNEKLTNLHLCSGKRALDPVLITLIRSGAVPFLAPDPLFQKIYLPTWKMFENRNKILPKIIYQYVAFNNITNYRSIQK